TASQLWLRGEVHAHVRNPLAPPQLIGEEPDANIVYAAAKNAGVDFVAMSVEATQFAGGADAYGLISAPETYGVVGIPAREIQNNLYGREAYFTEPGSRFLHVLTLGIDGGLSICAHPRFYEMIERRGDVWAETKSALLAPSAGGTLAALNVSG